MNKPLHFSMKIPCAAEFIAVARLAISGIASRMNFTIEEIEDIKVSLSEACTNAIQHAYDNPDPSKDSIELEVTINGDVLEIVIQDSGKGFDIAILGTEEQKTRSREKMGLGLGLTFIKSLMDSTDFKSVQGKGTTIKMSKRAPKLIAN